NNERAPRRGEPREGSPLDTAKEGSPLAPSSVVAPSSVAEERLAREAAPLRARIDADPTNVNAYLQLANLYRRGNHFDEAREALQRGLGRTGKPFDLILELADVETEPFRRNLVVTEDKLKTAPQDEELRKIRIRLLKEINTREMDLYRQKADRFPTELAHRL